MRNKVKDLRDSNMFVVLTIALFFGILSESLTAAMVEGVVGYNNVSDTIPDTISTGRSKSVADMNLQELGNLQVSPFNVSMQLDSGYRASNSVSGSRFDAPIRELPFAIQAFTETFIKDQKPVNIFDIARYSPSVTYRSNDFNEGNANLAIRGFAVGSLAGGNIHILRDGFHGPSIFDFTNISRVEVVKGPSSFLYGQVAPGGIVNIITKSPQSIFASSIDVRYGSYGQYRFDVDVTGPVSKTLFYCFTVSYDQDMHYWEPYNAHSRNISPSLLWQPNKRVSVTLKYENFRKVETPQVMQKPGYNTHAGVVPTISDPNMSGVDVPGLPDNWNSMSYSDFRHSKTNSLSAWLDFKVDDHWNLRTSYSYMDCDIDAVFSGNLGMANNTTRLQGRRVRYQDYANRDDSYETQAIGKYNFGWTNLRVLLGAQYIKRYLDRHAGQAANDPALGNNPIGSPFPLWDLSDPSTWNRNVTIPVSSLTESRFGQTVKYVDKSLYGGTTFGFFNDRMLLLAGWRLTTTENRLTDYVSGKSEPKVKASMVTPQYGVLYKATPKLSLFGTYAESFVPGTFQINNIDGTVSTAQSTEGMGFDIGLKADLLSGHLSGTFTYFDIFNKNIVNDLAVTSSSGIVTIYSVQSGEQRSNGVELDATIMPTDNWQLYISYSYINARITEFSGRDATILDQDPALLDAAGQTNYKNVKRFHEAPLQMSAPHLANLWTKYNFNKTLLRGFYIGGGTNFVYDQTLLPDGPISSHQTYTLLNITIGYTVVWHNIGINLGVMGKNLANEHYRPSQSTRSRPREFLLTLNIRY